MGRAGGWGAHSFPQWACDLGREVAHGLDDAHHLVELRKGRAPRALGPLRLHRPRHVTLRLRRRRFQRGIVALGDHLHDPLQVLLHVAQELPGQGEVLRLGRRVADLLRVALAPALALLLGKGLDLLGSRDPRDLLLLFLDRAVAAQAVRGHLDQLLARHLAGQLLAVLKQQRERFWVVLETGELLSVPHEHESPIRREGNLIGLRAGAGADLLQLFDEVILEEAPGTGHELGALGPLERVEVVCRHGVLLLHALDGRLQPVAALADPFVALRRGVGLAIFSAA
eukprot:6923281-Pyramimonas_sp.AAC.1